MCLFCFSHSPVFFPHVFISVSVRLREMQQSPTSSMTSPVPSMMSPVAMTFDKTPVRPDRFIFFGWFLSFRFFSFWCVCVSFSSGMLVVLLLVVRLWGCFQRFFFFVALGSTPKATVSKAVCLISLPLLGCSGGWREIIALQMEHPWFLWTTQLDWRLLCALTKSIVSSRAMRMKTCMTPRMWQPLKWYLLSHLHQLSFHWRLIGLFSMNF